MGTSNIPDVRVTLSAAGVDDIVRAFQNVAAAAKKSGKDSAAGMGVFNDALRQLKTLAPAIGFAAAAAGAALLVKNAVESAVQIGKLSEKTGQTTEMISTLAYTADQADVSFDALSGGLIKFNKTMALVDQGNATAGSAVRRLLGSSTALNGLDTEQRFNTVVTALGKMKDGYARTRAEQDFFGKSGAELDPLFRALAEGGLEEARKAAEKVGLVFSQQVVDAITVAEEAMKKLRSEAQGTATQFVSGLAPALAQAGDALVDATTGPGINGFQLLGTMAGVLVTTITKAFLVIGETIGFEVAEWSLWFDNFGQHAKDGLKDVALAAKIAFGAATGNPLAFVSADDLAQKADREKRRAAADDAEKHRRIVFNAQLAQQTAKLDDAPAPKTHSSTKAGGGSAQEVAAQNAHLAFLKAGLENELTLYKAQGDLVAAELQRQYDAGLISIDDYYAARAKTIQENNAKEIDAIAQQIETLVRTPIPVAANETDDQIAAKRIQRDQEIAALTAKIQVLQLTGQKEQADNLDKQFKDTKAFNDYRLDVESKIQAAEGNTLTAALAGIDKADADARAKAHADPTLNAALGKLKVLQKAKAGLDEIDRQGGLALSALSAQQAALQTQVASGEIFPFQAIEQYDAAVQKALPHLTDLVLQQTMAAVTPEEILKAQQFANTVLAMGAASSQTARDLSALKGGIESGLQNGLTQFFTTGIDGAKSFSDAIASMAQSIIQSIQQVVAQLLAAQIVRGILSLFSGGVPAFNVVPAGGEIGQSVTDSSMTAAEGGAIAGPGTSTSDSIPAMLSHGEFVVRARAVQQPGMLAMLHEINSAGGFGGILDRRVRSHRSAYGVAGYADGGLVAGAALDAVAGARAGSGKSGKLVIQLEEGLVVKHMDSTAGQKAIVRGVAKNKNSVKSTLGVRK